ncbi:mediator of RNA polymerase II transcription subunit 12-like [Copidosoma floridanum]|uniref:mediator of RNA polymerase II transcription subunit 12-like n=1 Tax=Copidosoma floridanum TaxID=29053 RepID=UPI0006C986FE|nr:mediator of RNA polymerase II transcription subunit 12-like [Copidosoma floridanum]
MRIGLWLLTAITSITQRTMAETPINGVKAANVLGGLQQHASFSFVRPGLTQTTFAFNGPSSHQTFSSSIGDPHLAHRVQPSLAQALAYRNPGLDNKHPKKCVGFVAYGNGPITTAYTSGAPVATNSVYQQQLYPQPQQQQQIDYLQQQQYQQALALAYQQQLQQQQYYQQQQQQPQQQFYSGLEQPVDGATQQQQAHFAQLFASRLTPQQQTATADVPEQVQQQQLQQQEQQSANLLGVAYSAAPSVAHVKVNGNGYKFDF